MCEQVRDRTRSNRPRKVSLTWHSTSKYMKWQASRCIDQRCDILVVKSIVYKQWSSTGPKSSAAQKHQNQQITPQKKVWPAYSLGFRAYLSATNPQNARPKQLQRANKTSSDATGGRSGLCECAAPRMDESPFENMTAVPVATRVLTCCDMSVMSGVQSPTGAENGAWRRTNNTKHKRDVIVKGLTGHSIMQTKCE